ncbi:unnamed protein product, partial [Rotaria magnacalcarata]
MIDTILVDMLCPSRNPVCSSEKHGSNEIGRVSLMSTIEDFVLDNKIIFA